MSKAAPNPQRWWLYSADVVADITEGTAFDKHGRPFRRRNYRPAICVFAVLALAAMVIWVVALNRPADVREAAVCNSPVAPADPAQPQLGQQVSRATMTEVAPAKLADTKIQVLNASGQGGQAAEVAGALRDLGFAATHRGQRSAVCEQPPGLPGPNPVRPRRARRGGRGVAGRAVRRIVPRSTSRRHRRPG